MLGFEVSGKYEKIRGLILSLLGVNALLWL